jgi:hypothetical protein
MAARGRRVPLSKAALLSRKPAIARAAYSIHIHSRTARGRARPVRPRLVRLARDYGKIYQRINLTNLRNSWGGEISIEKNTITIVTTRKGPADDSGVRETTTIEAIRP